MVQSGRKSKRIDFPNNNGVSIYWDVIVGTCHPMQNLEPRRMPLLTKINTVLILAAPCQNDAILAL